MFELEARSLTELGSINRSGLTPCCAAQPGWTFVDRAGKVQDSCVFDSKLRLCIRVLEHCRLGTAKSGAGAGALTMRRMQLLPTSSQLSAMVCGSALQKLGFLVPAVAQTL